MSRLWLQPRPGPADTACDHLSAVLPVWQILGRKSIPGLTNSA
nr:MAG TPA: hypothetical protein [Caudoviricetes sp.]